MDAPELLQHLPSRAAFSPAAMRKIECFHSERLLVGLNCLESGQAQPPHTHAGADKFYLVVSGKASFVVGGRTIEAHAGDLILAPAGVSHGVARAFERTVVLVAIAPAPSATG